MAKKILIVEDNDLILKLLDDLLQANGYHTYKNKDGFNVMDMAEKYYPDLILLDIKLSNISGLEIFKAIKSSKQLDNIPIVAVTAAAMEGDKRKILNYGFDAYIAKPMSGEYLLEIVNSFLPH